MQNFMELVQARESCRAYDAAVRPTRAQLEACVEAARLAPSACNSQPWHFTVVNEEALSAQVGACTRLHHLNGFTQECPAYIVVCEEPATLSARVASFVSANSFVSIDIGIATAHLCYAATAQGLSTCIMGMFDKDKLRELLNLKETQKVRLVLAIGKAAGEELRPKKRKPSEEILTYFGD